jgi:hypothetical protein
VVPEKDGEDQADRVMSERALHRVKDERDIIRKIERRKPNWIGHIWRWNCLARHVIEG